MLHRRWINLLPGQHIAVAGVTGAGKSSLLANLLLNLEPEVDEGTCLIYAIDLKGGVEAIRFGGYLRKTATTIGQAITMLEQLNQELDARNRQLLTAYANHVKTTRETPMIVIVIDEAGELSGAVDKDRKRQQEQARALLDRILRLGRAASFTVIMASQDPRKENLPLRDRCPVRIGMRLNSRDETIMVMGESAVKAGAACWLIGTRQIGTAFMFDTDTGRVLRFRVAPIDDNELAELRARYAQRIDENHDQKPDPTGDPIPQTAG